MIQKNCTQCSAEFEVTDRENALREKFSSMFEVGHVPPPTLCADCRMQKMMIQRNERILYSRKCDSTNKEIISVYPPSAPFPVYEKHEWWSDNWNPIEYGQSYDFNRPFFEQFSELQKKVPRPSLNTTNVENCDYCNFTFDSRNCYVSHCTYWCESLLYCYWSLRSNDCVDCSYCFESEQCLFCIGCNNSFNCVSCTLSHNCTDSYYLYDCRGCKDCFGCVGLRQQQYHMFNEKLSKDEYKKKA